MEERLFELCGWFFSVGGFWEVLVGSRFREREIELQEGVVLKSFAVKRENMRSWCIDRTLMSR